MTQVPILLFHSLDGGSSALSFSPVVFRRFMAELHGRGYRTLRLTEAVARLRTNEPLDPSAFVITFDDGYESVYTSAFPVLAEFGFSATLFVAPGENPHAGSASRLPAMQERPMLSWGEIDEMRRHGVDVGSHTLTHPDLTRLAPERAEHEIRRSREIIQERLGAASECFAYPFGYNDVRCREIVRRYYACACSARLGLAGPDSDPYALERVETYYLRAGRSFELMLSRGFSLYLRMRGVPRWIRRTLARRSV